MRLDVCSFLIRHAAYILFLKNTPIRGAYDITVRREETLLRYLFKNIALATERRASGQTRNIIHLDMDEDDAKKKIHLNDRLPNVYIRNEIP